MTGLIDPEQDFAADYRQGGEPDRDCPRLYAWQRARWGRTTPGRAALSLKVVCDRGYEMSLTTTDGKHLRLASDGIIPTWSGAGWATSFDSHVAAEISKDTDDVYRVASTIGGYVLFPRNRPGQAGHTINQARGVHRQIADRFDLTLECIRLHYTDPADDNPLAQRLLYYADFFAVFVDFPDYARHIHLADLVTDDQVAATVMAASTSSTRATPAWSN